MHMKVIGLCGGSGSGKSLVCSIFNELDIICIDADRVYHDMISSDSECSKELISVFGDEIAAEVGINRARLRELAFLSKDNLELLNNITHKHILKQTRLMISNVRATTDSKAVIFDAPLLFESGFDKECDITVCVIADDETRINRIIERDSITIDAARARIRAQIPNDELVKKCDYSIENNSSVDALRKRVLEIKHKIIDNN